MYDVIIVGAGPAGLTAAIYTSIRNLKTLVLSKGLSDQVLEASYIENYPGFEKIEGYKLIQKFEEQVRDFGVEIILEEVIEITPKNKEFIVKTTEKEYKSRTIILAFGKTPRTLNIPGEKEFTGKGISYCANCDAPLFRDKTVAVIGGGNAALDAALLLNDIAKKVYLVHRRDEFRGFESLVEEVKKKNVEFILNSVVTEFKGAELLKSMIIENVNTKEKKELKVDGVFIEIGSEVKTDFIKGLVELDDNNYIVINNNCETSHPGIFAAGDVTNIPFKQIVVAAGEGAKAGLNAYNYLHGIKPTIVMDWRKMKWS
ncbi:MAG: thioredoxin-disulfide reductase [Candidatus Aenigmarchaeota archaeon]|nr:thioredoxin-disulfide reductase [Candidatus Aenigmarchaeota archaeon]